jgi:CHRD domain/PEP-CTERM motif
MKLTFALPLVLASAVCLAAPGANATIQTFTVPLLGSNEVPSGSGDPDGFGTATLMIDDVALTIDWNISVSNLDTVILDHIHSGAAGTNGPVVVDFSGQLTGSGLADPDLAAVLANPTLFYVNVHTNIFTGGAIRGQVPEPSTALLLTAGLAILAGPVRRYRH